eukprot:gene22171-biopygen7176
MDAVERSFCRVAQRTGSGGHRPAGQARRAKAAQQGNKKEKEKGMGNIHLPDDHQNPAVLQEPPELLRWFVWGHAYPHAWGGSTHSRHAAHRCELAARTSAATSRDFCPTYLYGICDCTSADLTWPHQGRDFDKKTATGRQRPVCGDPNMCDGTSRLAPCSCTYGTDVPPAPLFLLLLAGQRPGVCVVKTTGFLVVQRGILRLDGAFHGSTHLPGAYGAMPIMPLPNTQMQLCEMPPAADKAATTGASAPAPRGRRRCRLAPPRSADPRGGGGPVGDGTECWPSKLAEPRMDGSVSPNRHLGRPQSQTPGGGWG